jgi:penicillin-binding protein 1B
LRIRIARGFWSSRIGLAVLGLAGFLFLAAAGTFTYFWVTYSRMIDARMNGQIFANTSRIFAAPPQVFVGESLNPAELVAHLRRTGYVESEVAGSPGLYRQQGNSVEFRTSAHSYFGEGGGLRVDFQGNKVSRILTLSRKQSVGSAEMEPELLSNLFDSRREKRRLVRFEDLPPHLVDAVLSAEDKRFFEHMGFDPIRVIGAAWTDLRRGEMAQGASTVSMQVARSFFFDTRREWRRKIAETLVALQLEQRFNKQQILELYANQIYLGNRSSFAIHGFGEAAQAYFGKDVREVNLGEAAFLAGIIRAPNRYSAPERNPERAVEARDRVLRQMVENGKISEEQAAVVRKGKLTFVAPGRSDTSAPYFVDMVRDYLLDRFDEKQLSQDSFRIYTTLDPDLQRAAMQAIAEGMKGVDEQLAKRYAQWRRAKGKGKTAEEVPRAQVALVALDPRTGQIKALVGGRDYGVSQLNRALARRQPGSAFKPFVYAAAFNTAVEQVEPLVTPVTTVTDEPTTFLFEDQEYSPNNYGADFRGIVTTRIALRHSLNVATVKVAEMVGYARVANIAHQIGLARSIRPTPAVALGAYEMSPVEVAAGYTVFANAGVRAEPNFIRQVLSAQGDALERNTPQTRLVLDPRVAYLVTNILEDVVNRGTAAGVRSRGFTAPAAGKTGTSHDGWFAGYISNLLCVVWVGFDDNRELDLPGSNSAAPIWTEFMKRATELPEYRDPQPFVAPEGVVRVLIDPETLELATPLCPATSEEVFLAGTEPTLMCERHGGSRLSRFPPVQWLSGVFGRKEPPPPPPPGASVAPAGSAPGHPAGAAPVQARGPAAGPPPGKAAEKPEDKEEKKGLLGRIFGIFGSKKDKDKKEQEKKPAP